MEPNCGRATVTAAAGAAAAARAAAAAAAAARTTPRKNVFKTYLNVFKINIFKNIFKNLLLTSETDQSESSAAGTSVTR